MPQRGRRGEPSATYGAGYGRGTLTDSAWATCTASATRSALSPERADPMTENAARQCDAVNYRFRAEADYEQEIPCAEPATVVVPLSDGRLHPRCKAHIPMMLRALARPL